MFSVRVHYLIGVILFFLGLGVMGSVTYDAYGTPDPVGSFLGAVIAVAGLIWVMWKVRCPHCNKMIFKRIGVYDVCPYCNNSTR